jgi:hypothetical protein
MFASWEDLWKGLSSEGMREKMQRQHPKVGSNAVTIVP